MRASQKEPPHAGPPRSLLRQKITSASQSDVIAPSRGKWLASRRQRLDREGTKYITDLCGAVDGGPAVANDARRNHGVDALRFDIDGALAFLSNRQPNEISPTKDAATRMQVLGAAATKAAMRASNRRGPSRRAFIVAPMPIAVVRTVARNVVEAKQRETRESARRREQREQLPQARRPANGTTAAPERRSRQHALLA